MTQKLLVMQRDSKQDLMDAIRKNILERGDHHSGSNRVTSLSIFKDTNMVQYEAWIIVEVPDNKEKLYELAAGFES